MAAKQKTSVRARAKPTNKNNPKPTDKARKAASAEIAERLERLEAGETNGPQDHEVQSAKEVANDRHIAAAAREINKRDRAAAKAEDPAPAVPPAPTSADLAAAISASFAEGKPPRERTGKKSKAAKEPKPRKVSGLDAAALVLAETGAPMKAVDMLAEIQKRGLWASKGRTPEATLYAAIIREIAAKGNAARFKKHDRGLFVAAAAAGKGE